MDERTPDGDSAAPRDPEVIKRRLEEMRRELEERVPVIHLPTDDGLPGDQADT